MAHVALVVHFDRSVAAEEAAALARWLETVGCEVRLPEPDAALAGLEALACPDDKIGEELEVAISLGGDGSMLRTISLVADDDVPVLGVNYGRVGYLTEVDAADARRAIERVLAGDYDVEERMRLDVSVASNDHEYRGRALNEAILEKVDSGRTVGIEVTVDGESWMTCAADGLIVCTPTGSTAYSLSAGGPIVAPTHEALVITPVAPHTLFDRSLVLPPESRIRVELLPDRPAGMSLDGRFVATLQAGEAMVCTASDRPARLVTFGGRNFQEVLTSKFGLNAR